METAADIVNNSHDLELPIAKNVGLASLGNARIKLVFADHLRKRDEKALSEKPLACATCTGSGIRFVR